MEGHHEQLNAFKIILIIKGDILSFFHGVFGLLVKVVEGTYVGTDFWLFAA